MERALAERKQNALGKQVAELNSIVRKKEDTMRRLFEELKRSKEQNEWLHRDLAARKRKEQDLQFKLKEKEDQFGAYRQMFEESRNELLLSKDAINAEKERAIVIEEVCKGQCARLNARIEDLEHQLALRDAEVERRKREYSELKFQMRLGGSPPGRNASDKSFEQLEERDHPFGRASVLSEGGSYTQR